MNSKLKMTVYVIGSLLIALPQKVQAASDAELSIKTELIEINNNSYQYRITAKNNGPEAASRLIISSPLPDGVTGYVTHKIGGQECADYTGSQFSFCYTYVPAGGSVIIDMAMQTSDPKIIHIQQQSSVGSDTTDSNLENNNTILNINLVQPIVSPTPTPSNNPKIIQTRANGAWWWRRFLRR